MKPLALLLAPAALIADSASADPIAALSSIGIGALIALPFIFLWRAGVKRNDQLETKVDELQSLRLADKQAELQRERELSDTMSPLLHDVAELLKAAPTAIDQAMDKAQNRSQRNDADLRMRQIEMAVDAMLKRFTPPETT